MSDGEPEHSKKSALETRRQSRRDVQVAGRYRAGLGVNKDIWIKDVTAEGCRMFDKYSTLQPGRQISVKIGNIGPIAAEVRWREQNTVGIRFEQPLHSAVLEHVVQYMDEQEAKDS